MLEGEDILVTLPRCVQQQIPKNLLAVIWGLDVVAAKPVLALDVVESNGCHL